MTFSAAIFDMDGLLLDTERLCLDVFEQTCQHLGLPFLREVYTSTIGCNAQYTEPVIIQGYAAAGIKLDYEQLRTLWRTNYDAIITQQAVPTKTGVIELLDWLKSQRIPIAVATSSDRASADSKLGLAQLDSYFDVYATGCEVTQSKPHPEIFLLAAERLGVAPSACLAFEDSNNGVKAAIAAQMRTYHIPDLVPPSDEVLALKPLYFASMHEVLADLKSQVI